MLDLQELTYDQLKTLKEGKQLDLQDLNYDQLQLLKQKGYAEDKQMSQDPSVYNFSQLNIRNPFGADDNIDNMSGVRNFDFRSNFAEQDNEEERVAYLQKKVGAEGFGKDPQGRYYLTDVGLAKIGEDPLSEGKRGRLIDADLGFFKNLNPLNPDFIYDLAELKSSIGLPLLGAIGASIATGGMGAIPAAMITGLGGGIGKALDEFVFNGEDMELSDTTRDIAYEAMLSAGGEGLGRGLRGIYRYLLAPGQRTTATNLFTTFDDANKALEQQGFEKSLLSYRKFDPKAQIAQELGQGTQNLGALPSILQATDRPILGRFQGMFDTIFGNPREYFNQRFMNNEMTKMILKARGVDVAADSEYQLLLNKLTKQGPRTFLGRPSKELEAYSAKLQQLAKQTFTDSNKGPVYNELFKNNFVNPEFLFKVYREGGENAFQTLKSSVQGSEIAAKEAERNINKLLSGLFEQQVPKTQQKVLSNDVIKNAQQAYVNYQRESQVLWSRVDQMFGDRPIIDSAPIKNMLMQKIASGEIVLKDATALKQVLELVQNNPRLTHSQAKGLINALDSLNYHTNPLEIGMPQQVLMQARQFLDEAIGMSSKEAGVVTLNQAKNKTISDWLSTNPNLLGERVPEAFKNKLNAILAEGAEGALPRTYADLPLSQKNQIFDLVKENINYFDDAFLSEGFKKGLKQAVQDRKTIQEAIRVRNIAKYFTKNNILKFEVGTAKTLLKQVQATGAIDPSQLRKIVLRNNPDDLLRILKEVKFGEGKPFAKAIEKMGKPLQEKELKTLAKAKPLPREQAERIGLRPGEEVSRKIITEDEVSKTKLFMTKTLIQDILTKSRNSITNNIDASKFARNIKTYGASTGSRTPSTLEIIAGKQEAARLMGLADELSNATGTIDETLMRNLMNSKYLNREISNVDDVVNSVRNELNVIKEYNELGGFIGDITKPGMEGIRAIDAIFSPSNIKQFEKISKVLSQSEEGLQSLNRIRLGGMNKLLQKMVDDTSSIVDGVLLNGQKLRNEISRLGVEPSLRSFFGEGLAKELIDFANQATFLGQKKTLSGGIVAASIALNPLAKAPILVQMNVLSRLMGSRSFMNLLNRGIRSGNVRDIAEIARIVGIQTETLMKNVDDPEAFNFDLRPTINKLGQDLNKLNMTPPVSTQPAQQPAQQSSQPTTPVQTPPTEMFTQQSIPDKIATLFPQDTLSQAIAKRSQG